MTLTSSPGVSGACSIPRVLVSAIWSRSLSFNFLAHVKTAVEAIKGDLGWNLFSERMVKAVLKYKVRIEPRKSLGENLLGAYQKTEDSENCSC
ncbi:hypothetical protein FHG87_018125 [Trinorchestia longiramus]|nr:hypothetical protein FHG87_018125 [Trinorchestia longiramus]